MLVVLDTSFNKFNKVNQLGYEVFTLENEKPCLESLLDDQDIKILISKKDLKLRQINSNS